MGEFGHGLLIAYMNFKELTTFADDAILLECPSTLVAALNAFNNETNRSLGLRGLLD